jgi:hypothetical protein
MCIRLYYHEMHDCTCRVWPCVQRAWDAPYARPLTGLRGIASMRLQIPDLPTIFPNEPAPEEYCFSAIRASNVRRHVIARRGRPLTVQRSGTSEQKRCLWGICARSWLVRILSWILTVMDLPHVLVYILTIVSPRMGSDGWVRLRIEEAENGASPG